MRMMRYARQRALGGRRRRPQEIDPRSLVIPAREERCGAPIRAESRSNLAAGRRYRQSRVNGRRCITRSSLVRAANSIRSKSREIVGPKHATFPRCSINKIRGLIDNHRGDER